MARKRLTADEFVGLEWLTKPSLRLTPTKIGLEWHSAFFVARGALNGANKRGCRDLRLSNSV